MSDEVAATAAEAEAVEAVEDAAETQEEAAGDAAPTLPALYPFPKPILAMTTGELIAELSILRAARATVVESLPENKRKRRKLATFSKKLAEMVKWIAQQKEVDQELVVAELRKWCEEERGAAAIAQPQQSAEEKAS